MHVRMHTRTHAHGRTHTHADIHTHAHAQTKRKRHQISSFILKNAVNSTLPVPTHTHAHFCRIQPCSCQPGKHTHARSHTKQLIVTGAGLDLFNKGMLRERRERSKNELKKEKIRSRDDIKNIYSLLYLNVYPKKMTKKQSINQLRNKQINQSVN